jgi:hypothetical protein
MKLFRTNLLIALVTATTLAAGHRLLHAADTAPSATKPAADTVIYTCPMHPRVQSAKPGTCPQCHMALVAKKVTGAAPAKASQSTAADSMAGAATSTPDHAGMKMSGSGSDMNGMDMKGMSGAGMGNCPMGGCPMGMSNMPTAMSKAAKVPVPAIPVASGGGGCGCR